jgi:4-amino-4-deoxy-L-arabinose transferase-like glycosyltransferase
MTSFLRGRMALVLSGAAIAAVFFWHQFQLSSDPSGWSQADGYEYLWIAESLAQGEGFSFPADHRWLFTTTDRDRPDMPDYAATAWKEPIYPYILGGAIWLFGPEGGKAVVVGIQVAALAITIIFTYLLGSALLGQWTGVLAAGLIAFLRGPAHNAVTELSPSIMGAMIVTGVLLLVLRSMNRLKVGAALTLGAGIGVGALTLAPTVLLGLVAALGLSVEAMRRRSLRPLAMVFVVALTAMVVISPWTVRNARVFGMFIPLQTGLGNFANYSNTYLAETFMPELQLDPLGSGPPWISAGPLDAVKMLPSEDHVSGLFTRSLISIAAAPPAGWEDMSEPERDRVHLAQFRGFVADHPGVFFEIVVAKAMLRFLFSGKSHLILSAAALLGLVLTLRRRSVYLLPASVILLTAPLLVTAPMYYRYRLPVEPLIAILAVGAVVVLAKTFLHHYLATRMRKHSKHEWGNGLADSDQDQRMLNCEG